MTLTSDFDLFRLHRDGRVTDATRGPSGISAFMLHKHDDGFTVGARAERREGDLSFISSACKCFASDVAMSVTTDAVQLFGGGRLRHRNGHVQGPAMTKRWPSRSRRWL